jgi:uncharacterized membrane protein
VAADTKKVEAVLPPGDAPEDTGGSFKQFRREWKQWEGTDTQVETGFRCYVRPNRSTKRTFDADSAARAVCAAIKHGTTKAEIDREVRDRCLPGKETICDCDKVRDVLLQVLTAAAAIAIILAIARTAALALPVLLSTVIIRLLPRRIAGLLTGAREAVLRLPDSTRTIEGVFFRVNEAVKEIQRRNPGTISSSGVRG